MFSYITALTLLSLVLAQDNSTASTTDLEGAQANFQQAQLVPQFVTEFNPTGVLEVSFSGQAINIGQNISQTDVASYPSLSFLPGASANVTTDDRFTVILADADVVGTDETTTPQTRHWLVNSASVSTANGSPYTVGFDGATTITDYAGPGPAAGSGSHRYVLLMYAQPTTFTAPANLSTAGTPLGTFFVQAYHDESGLGDLVAANYFQVENGVATATVAATTAVNSATLAGAASTTGTGTSSAASMAGSASAAATTGSTAASGSGSSKPSSSAASASASGAAHSQTGELAWGLILGGVGVVGAVVGAGLGF